MVQVLFDWSVPVHPLQWCPVWIGPRPLRGTAGISPRTCVVYSVLCRCHQYSHQTRLFCSFLRRRSADLWSFFADNLLKFGAKDVCLHRRNQHMDGQQPSKTQSIKNWGNMVGFITTAEALPNGRSEYRRCFDQAFQPCSGSRGVRRRWSVSGGSHLSSLPHVLLSPSSATCRVPESHHGTLLTRSSEHLFTVGSTIAMVFWLACHRLRSTGFNPFSVQQLALCCSYQAGPVSRIWCVCSSTGFPFHRGFSSSCAQWCTGVFTTRRRYTYEISACPSHLLRVVLTSDRPQPETFAFHRQRLWQSAGVDFLLPVLRLGTIYPLLWKTIN